MTTSPPTGNWPVEKEHGLHRHYGVTWLEMARASRSVYKLEFTNV
jgi:hypothetical protein